MKTLKITLMSLIFLTLFSINALGQFPTYLATAAKTEGISVVDEVLFSPDGQLFAVVGRRNISLSDPKTTKHLHTIGIEHHPRLAYRAPARVSFKPGEPGRVSFSPDSSLIAAIGYLDNGNIAIQIWDVKTRIRLQTFEGFYNCSFSPDGSLLVGVTDREIRIWEVGTWHLLRTYEGFWRRGYLEHLHSFRFSPDGSLLAGASEQETRIWDVKTGALLHTHDGVWNILFSPDGSFLIGSIFAQKREIRIWDAKTGAHLRSLDLPDNNLNSNISLSPDGQLLAVWGPSEGVQLWDVNTGIHLHTLTEQHYRTGLSSVLFSPDGRMLVGRHRDSITQFWDVKTGTFLGKIGYSRAGGSGEPWAAANMLSFSPDGEILASSAALWRFATTSRTLAEDTQFNLQENAKARHGAGRIYDIKYSPDSTRLAAAGSIGVWLYDGQTGELIDLLSKHTGRFWKISFSPDGQILASANADHTVHLWDANTGAYLRILEGHTDEVFDVSFSPDGQRLASGSADGTVRLWDVNTWQLRHTFEAHTQGQVHIVSFSPDARTFASVSGTEIRLWEVGTWQQLHTLTAHTSPVAKVSFSPDGKILASVAPQWDNSVRIWDVSTGSHLHRFHGLAEVNGFSFSPDGKLFAKEGWTPIPKEGFTPIPAEVEPISTPHLWDVSTWQLVRMFKPQFRTSSLPGKSDRRNFAIAFSPDGKLLATRGDAVGIYLWDVSTGSLLRMLPKDARGPLPLLFSPDGEVLVEVGDAGIHFWEVRTGKFLNSHTGYAAGWLWTPNASFSPDGQLFISKWTSKNYLWSVSTGNLLNTQDDIVERLLFSPDGKIIFGSTLRKEILFWDANTGEHIFKRSAMVGNFSFSPDGSLFAVARGTLINIYEASKALVEDPILRHSINTQTGGDLSFSPDGQLLASWKGIAPRQAGDGKIIQIWDVTTGQLRHTLEGHTSVVWSASFSPDGRTCASISNAETNLWDVSTGQLLHTFEGHTSRWEPLLSSSLTPFSYDPFFSPTAFSPDGRTFANVNGTEINLWDVTTGQVLHTFEGHTRDVWRVSFSPDGQLLVSASDAREAPSVRVWDVLTSSHLHTFYNGNSFSFSPDGQIFTSINGTEINLWDVSTWELLSTLRGHTVNVGDVFFSPDGSLLASVSERGGLLFLWDVTAVSTPKQSHLATDVNQDGVVNIQDLVAVAAAIGQSGENAADVNGDGEVNIQDLVAVAAALGQVAAAPTAIRQQATAHLTTADVRHWIAQAQQLDLTAPRTQRGLLFLQYLLATLTPQETILLANYPNPFNPETWIPYQLANPADVSIAIYAIDGKLVRALDLGHQPVGIYESKSRAAYWDGRNAVGEPVSSGVYFYTLKAGEFAATRKMLIRK